MQNYILGTTSFFVATFTKAFAVPGFAMLSGMFMVKSKKPRYIYTFYLIIVCLIFKMIFEIIINSIHSSDYSHWYENIYKGGRDWWYLIYYFILMLVAPFLNIMLNKLPKYGSLCIVIILMLCQKYVFWTDPILITYYCAGGWFALYLKEYIYKRKYVIISIITIVVLFIANGIYNKFPVEPDLTSSAYWLYFFFKSLFSTEAFYSFPMSLAFIIIFLNIKLPNKYFINWLGQSSLFIYLSHSYFQLLLEDHWYAFLHMDLSMGNSLFFFLTYLIITSCATVFSLIVCKPILWLCSFLDIKTQMLIKKLPSKFRESKVDYIHLIFLVIGIVWFFFY